MTAEIIIGLLAGLLLGVACRYFNVSLLDQFSLVGVILAAMTSSCSFSILSFSIFI